MSVEIGANLGGVGKAITSIFSDIEGVHDRSAALAIQNFLKIVESAVDAKKAGVSEEQFAALLQLVGTERDTITDGEIEVAGSVSTGLETVDGKSFDVSFNAGGSIAGFTLGANAGYKTASSKTTEEKTSQNFRILARWVTVPKGSSPELIKAATAFAFRLPDGVKVPDGITPPTGATSYIDLIKQILPVVTGKPSA